MRSAIIDEILTWTEIKITKEKIKWTVRVFKVFALSQKVIFSTYCNKTLSQLTLVWYVWFCSKPKQNQKAMMKNITKLVHEVLQSMLSEPRTAIILRYIVASSSWRSPVIAVNQAWNFIFRPSVSSVTTAEFFSRCHLEKSSCSNEFDCRSFIKHTPLAVCFLIVTFVNLRLFMSHDLAGVLWIFHFQILSLDLKRSKQKSWLRPVDLFRFVNYFRLELWCFDTYWQL